MVQKTMLSQMTAILLEHAYRKTPSEIELQNALQEKDTDFLRQLADERMDYKDFFSYMETHDEDAALALKEGYEIKFNTLKGLKLWLHEKFNWVEDVDYKQSEDALIDFTIHSDQLGQLNTSLAKNWVVKTNDEDENKEWRDVSLEINKFLA
ncbi:hypothetical protein ACE1TF_13305 [Geomicrobium sp. JSM 1781026]|uniref:hypothetical protein n=1 Tax=Geomicrobium sp. JSM 1781026 TaxID=3344580 RepID=UPI0035C0889E